jgi:hypothetical protein
LWLVSAKIHGNQEYDPFTVNIEEYHIFTDLTDTEAAQQLSNIEEGGTIHAETSAGSKTAPQYI